MNCSPSGLEEGLIGYWNFEEGTNEGQVLDLSINGNNGIINGSTYNEETPEQICSSCSGSDEINVTFSSQGCTDELACNYDSSVICDDGSCTYAIEYYNCDGNCLNDLDLDGVCDELDNCIGFYNPNQDDFDGDGVGDDCDGIGIMEELLFKKIIKVTDILGKEVDVIDEHGIYIYIYNDGSIEKKLLVK